MTQTQNEKKFTTCPFKPSSDPKYERGLCSKYCELWNEKGECCSFYFLAHIADLIR